MLAYKSCIYRTLLRREILGEVHEVHNPLKPAESARMPHGILVQPRKPQLEDLSDLPKYWFANNALLTHISNVFSIFIPDGERFFIKAVKHYEDQLQDPELKAMVRAFVQQEAQHYKAQEYLNDDIKATGVAIDPVLRRAEKTFKWFENYLPQKLQLSMTVALEHLTATGAEIILAEPKWQDQLHGKMNTFWSWHAIEELEHKSVAYDVYKEVGEGHGLRLIGATIVLGLLAGPVIYSIIELLKADGQLRDRKMYKHARRAIASKKAAKISMRNLKDYLSPRFHPWKQENREII